jgi:hypothetical protein
MILCAFDGHIQRAKICQGEATSFFRTAKGTLWPLCTACAEQHKKVILAIAHGVDPNKLIGATFDIPIDDPEAVKMFKDQDPEIIRRIIRRVDTSLQRPPQ